uniref:Small ribosomal subunit protein uS3c n=1 Tax=Pseudochlorodesmis sp. HV01306c TaxID=2358490 RepID=A0A386AYG4_9CHLO|nr:ribosomal protein S3 [Pseudochlorodesmis sp. HV01306c]
MGQKVHPIGFRLGINQAHLSNWFAQKKNYSKNLLEDNFLRKKLQQRYMNAGLEKIQIVRKIENHIEVNINAKKPDIIVGPKGKDLTIFQQEIREIVNEFQKSFFLNKSKHKTPYNKKSKNIKITLNILGCSTMSATSIADFLIELLEQRVPYRIALNQLLKKKLQQKPLGIKIQISGRLNGAEIARKEWIREGRLPLQTLQANIDYSFKKAHTIYGILGVKVWLYSKHL